ncbi:hypothetical protein Tco_0464376 [Tanacetum coccineum]
MDNLPSCLTGIWDHRKYRADSNANSERQREIEMEYRRREREASYERRNDEPLESEDCVEERHWSDLS